jgi:hypothetical protein
MGLVVGCCCGWASHPTSARGEDGAKELAGILASAVDRACGQRCSHLKMVLLWPVLSSWGCYAQRAALGRVRLACRWPGQTQPRSRSVVPSRMHNGRAVGLMAPAAAACRRLPQPGCCSRPPGVCKAWSAEIHWMPTAAPLPPRCTALQGRSSKLISGTLPSIACRSFFGDEMRRISNPTSSHTVRLS